MREFSITDRVLMNVDMALRTVLPPTHRVSQRLNPSAEVSGTALSEAQARHVAGLMRVNHAGEVCAQALYQGQALTAKQSLVKEQMRQAAQEETDHLAWCEQRLSELGSHPSRLIAIWYVGSLFLGAMAGLAGDRWSLGFVAETEKQVSEHLQRHLNHLPEHDLKTKALLSQMQADEAQHAQQAQQAGGVDLPDFFKQAMRYTSKLMTVSSYYF